MTAIPTPYTRQSSFTLFQTEAHPTSGTGLEAEFNRVKTAMDATQGRLAEIQRGDGRLRNGIVTPDSLSTSVRAILAGTGGSIRGEWVTVTEYDTKDVVSFSGVTYVAVDDHTSSLDFAVDIANGHWLALTNDGHLSLRAFGARGNAADDDTDVIVAALATASELGVALYVPAGTYMVHHIDETYDGNLTVLMAPGAVIKGFPSYQHYPGTGAAMTVSITDFDYYASGINVVINDGTSQTELDLTTDYTIAGDEVTTLGVVPIGQTLQISSKKAIVTLRAGVQDRTIDTQTLQWYGGKFDTSDRGYSEADASGSALTIHNWRAPLIKGVSFYAADSWEDAEALGIGGDSGISTLLCTGVMIVGCYFQGLADLGIYITGGSSAASLLDDGGAATVTGCTFYRCATGVKAVRQTRGFMVFGNSFYECMTGVLSGAVDNGGIIGAGYDYIVQGNLFQRITRRAIDLREMRGGATVTGNRIIDWGFLHDGVTEPFSAPNVAIFVSGCPRTRIANNHLEFREWVGTAQRGVLVNASTLDVVNPTAVTVHHNTFIGVGEGIVESGGAGVHNGNRYTDNRMISVTTPCTIQGANTVWDYIEEDGDVLGGIGNVAAIAPSGSYTPALTNQTNLSASTAYACSYQRNGRVVTVSGMVDITPTANSLTTELRIAPPIAASFTAAEQAGGSGAFSLVAAGTSAPRIFAQASGANVRMVFVSGAASAGVSYTVSFQFTYRIP